MIIVGELCRAALIALCLMILVWPLSALSTALLAGGGAFVGSLVGIALHRSRLRTWVSLLGLATLSFLLWLGRSVWLSSAALGETLGPAQSLLWVEGCTAAVGAGLFACLLRLLSARARLFGIIEIVVVAVAFGHLLSAHRYGAINRPFGLADPVIALGGDPSAVLLGVGAFAGLVAVSLLLREREPLRAALHLGALLAVLLLALAGTKLVGLPTPEAGGGAVSLRGDKPAKPEKQDKGKPKPKEGSKTGDVDFDNRPPPPKLAQAPIGVILFHDDYSPPSGWYYFRQSALSQYNGRRLVSARAEHINDDLVPGFVSTPIDVSGAPESDVFRSEIETSVALLVDDHTQPPALEAPRHVTPATNPDPSRFSRVYRVRSAVVDRDFEGMLGQRAGSDKWDKTHWAHYTDAPTDPRYRALGEQILQQVPDSLATEPIVKALAVSGWLSKHGIYSLKHKHVGKEDPTASFLFGDKTGYCVHFAHAAAYLMRTMGLPARVGTGYAVDEATRQGGSALILADADSHAWPEVYIQDAGWIVVDVAPEQSLDPPAPPKDPDLQRLMGELARGAKPILPDQQAFEEMVDEAKAFGLNVGQGAAALVLAFLAAMFAVKWWRRAAPVFAKGRALARVQYRALLDALSEVSLRRERGESREAFAARLSRAFPSFDSVTRLHLAAVFGAELPDLSSIGLLAGQVTAERRSAVVWWRRWLGAINPISWWWSR